MVVHLCVPFERKRFSGLDAIPLTKIWLVYYMFNCLTLKVKVKVTQVRTRPRYYGGSSLCAI